MSEQLVHAPPATVTTSDLRAAKKSRENLPPMKTLQDRFAPGYRETQDGWAIDLGKCGARAAAEMAEMFHPFSRSEATRARRRSARRDVVRMRDGNGAERYVPPHLVRPVALRNGWREKTSRGGLPLVSGPEGMLFRCVGGAWEATGVRCLGQPLRGPRHVPRRGIQHDPRGQPWRWVAGAWRKVG